MPDYIPLPRPDEEMVTVDRHLYLTEDRSRVVEEGDPAGRWLWAAPAQRKPRQEAVRLGGLNPEPAAVKMADPPANKQRRPSANKSSGTRGERAGA